MVIIRHPVTTRTEQLMQTSIKLVYELNKKKVISVVAKMSRKGAYDASSPLKKETLVSMLARGN